jgi:hypothetical protein
MRALLIPDGTRPSQAAVHAAFRVLDCLSEAHNLVARLVVDRGTAAAEAQAQADK